LIILIILGEEFTLWSSSLCSFLHPPVTSSLFRPNICTLITKRKYQIRTRRSACVYKSMETNLHYFFGKYTNTSPPCVTLDVSQPYGPPWPVTGIDLPFF
jgi:hypothetical protein